MRTLALGCIRAVSVVQAETERERIPLLPLFNPGWYPALIAARKEWLKDHVAQLEADFASDPAALMAELLKLPDIDLADLGLARKKLVVRGERAKETKDFVSVPGAMLKVAPEWAEAMGEGTDV